MAMTSQARLCDEYWAWTAEHGLPDVSAPDLAHEPDLLTDDERRYVANFIKRWVKMKTQTRKARRLVTSAERDPFIFILRGPLAPASRQQASAWASVGTVETVVRALEAKGVVIETDGV